MNGMTIQPDHYCIVMTGLVILAATVCGICSAGTGGSGDAGTQWPPELTELHFPATIDVSGQILVEANGNFYRSSAYAVEVYLEDSLVDDPADPANAGHVKYLDTIQPDANGKFTYQYQYHPEKWRYLRFMPATHELDGVTLTITQNPEGAGMMVGSGSPALTFDLEKIWYLAGSTPVHTGAEWRITPPALATALPDAGIVQDLDGMVNEPKIAAQQYNGWPYIYAGVSFDSNRYHADPVPEGVIFQINRYDFFTREPCFRYLSFRLHRDGQLWNYLKKRYGYVYDADAGTHGEYSVAMYCNNDHQNKNFNPADCGELNIVIINKNPDPTTCTRTNTNKKDPENKLMEYRLELDYSRLDKNDPPLTGMYAGFTPLDPDDIMYIGQNGIDPLVSSSIAAKSRIGRTYADLSFVGDCNRDNMVDENDIAFMNDIIGKQEPFDTICDMNGDRTIDAADLDLLAARFSKNPLVGDCNHDYRIDYSDVEYMKMLIAEKNMYYEKCNMNADGVLDMEDVSLLIGMLGSGSSDKQTSSADGNQTSPGSFIPEGIGDALPRDRVAVLPENEGGTTPQAGPVSIIDMIVSIPRTIISIVSLSPATTQETRAGQQDAEISIADISSDDRGDDAVTLIDLSTGNEQPGNLNPGFETDEPEKYFSGDYVTVRDLDSEQEYRNNTGDAAVPENTGGTILQVGITTTAAIELQPRTGRIACPEGRVSCTGACINVNADASNCGACGNACPDGYTCYLGTCMPVCESGAVSCNGACVDLQTDPDNCGACGNACMTGAGCENGRCVARMVTTQSTLAVNTGRARL